MRDVGGRAGCTLSNTRLSSGSIGAPESRLEMEIELESLAAWERFLASLPMDALRSWSQRVRSCIVDGSPRWEVYQACPLLQGGAQQAAGAAAASNPAGVVVGNSSSGSSTGSSSSQSLFSPASGLVLPTADQLAQDLTALAGAGAPGLGLAGSGGSGSLGARPAAVPPPSAAAPAASSSTDDSKSGGGDGEVVLDWKGEPMKIRPGDKLPFKFL